MLPRTISPAGTLLLCVSVQWIVTSAVAEEPNHRQSTDSAAALPQRGICAHRGASATRPENTLSALSEAVRLGAHMVEFDVQLTKDGQLVLMHDTTVDRTTTGSGTVSDLTLDELKQFDAGSWRGEQFVGERIPTLAEALAIMPTNIWLNVHLKGDVTLAEKTVRRLRDDARLQQAFLACDRASAAAAKKIAPQIQICNMDRQLTPAQYAQTTVEGGAEFIQLLGRRWGALEQIPLLRKQHVRINFCCTNDGDQLGELFATGVDFPLVDQVAQMLKVAEGLGIERLRPLVRVK